MTPLDKSQTNRLLGYPLDARLLMINAAEVRMGPGLGIFWWEATWTAVSGNGWDPACPSSGNAWENQALFDFNNRALPAMSLFRQP